MIEYYPDWQWSYAWILYLGFFFCFLVAFGMGANDCANSYATVVGARVLKLWQAYILATIFEISGAGLLGYKVTSTMTKSVVDVDIYSVFTEPINNTYEKVDQSCLNFTHPNCTEYTEASFGIGELAALMSTSAWLLFATIMRLPVSTTQSAVGATVGFSLVLKGPDGIHWRTIVGIVISWVSSPLLAGLMAVVFYIVVKYTVLKKDNQFQASLRMLPFFYWFALTVNIFAVTYDGSKYLGFNKLTWYECLAISFGIGTLVGLFSWFYGRHWVKKRVEALNKDSRLSAQIRASESRATSLSIDIGLPSKGQSFTTDGYVDPVEVIIQELNGATKDKRSSTIKNDDKRRYSTDSGLILSPNELDKSESQSKDLDQMKRGSISRSSSRPSLLKRMSVETLTKLKDFKHPVEEDPLATEVFHYLQIMSACFLSFSHGSNDTANCVGSLVGIWLIFMDEYVGVDSSNDPTLEYLILFGAISMVIGLWILGHKVIQTMGNKITEVTAPSGFCMELGTAFTVLFASKIGIPVSTTHCAVGAIVAVGWFKSHKGGVSWKLFKNIALAWLVTLPVAGLLSALLTFLLNFTVK